VYNTQAGFLFDHLHEAIMKQTTVAIAVIGALTLSACSSLPFGLNSGVTPAPVTPVKEERVELSTEFKREGVKVYYTLTGDVDRIEAQGFAQVWQQQYEHVAELEAKEKLIKFLRGESVTSTRKTEVMARAMERAQDNTLNRFKNTDGSALNFVAEDLEKPAAPTPTAATANPDENSRSNTARRMASINNAQVATSTITVTAAGRLTAVAKVSGKVVDDGKLYVGTYAWSPKNQNAARTITNLMDAK
jgi:hypothetical protein